MKQGWRKQAARQNKILAQELGRVVSGESRYRWIWSEDPDFYRSKRNFTIQDDNKIIPEWDQIETEDSPVVTLKPTYTREKLVPKIIRSFVMCRWIPNGTFSEHLEKYGDMVEWAGEGSYWPMEHPRGIVQLCQEVCPSDEDTWEFIRLVRRDTTLGMEEIIRQAEARDKSDEDRAFQKNAALLDPLLPRYDHIPGKRGSGGISLRDPGLEKFDGAFRAAEPQIVIARD